MIALVATAAPASAQQASISGRILGDDGKPIARAAVKLAGPGLVPSLVVFTEANGDFRFAGVPAGQFTVTASKFSYLTMAFGQTTPGRGGGVPIAVTEGQPVSGLTWKLPRGAIITGRVLDHRGQPMRDVPIVLMQYRTADDQRTLTSVTCCVWPQTEGDGTYRVFGILPGEYLVSAIPPGSYRFVPSGPWSANVQMFESSAAEIQWALQQIGGRTGGAPAPEPAPGRTVAYGRVYYPNTTDEKSATVVTLAAGEERRGVDFSMNLYPTARVEGRIVGPDGQTVAGPRISMGGITLSGAGISLSYRNLLPGRYTITARTVVPPLWGTIDVDVNGRDVLDVVLRLEPSPSISGRVVFEPGSRPSPDPTAARIALRPVGIGALPNSAEADGTFRMRQVDPGRYRILGSLTGPAASTEWTLKSAMLGNRDVADQAIDLRPGEQVTDVVVTFTDRPTELSGTLVDAVGRPAPGYFVVVFPADPALWSPGSRRLPAPVRAATDGRFRFAGLPPGTYHVAAMSTIDQADLSDAGFLRHLSGVSIQVTLAEGERKIQNLKLGR